MMYIFFNIFYRDFLHDLEMCGDDPVKVAECFVKNNDGFKIYAQYCTNYPRYVNMTFNVYMLVIQIFFVQWLIFQEYS